MNRVNLVILLVFAFFSCKLHAMVNTNPSGAATSMTSDKKPMIEPGVCSIGDTIKCGNDGKSIGMFDVSIGGAEIAHMQTFTSPTTQFGTSIKVVNKKDPKKAVYLGYVSSNRQSQIFKGNAEVLCYACTGSAAQSPNERSNPCPNSLDQNYCVSCSKEPIPCASVLTIQRAQAKGAEARAQDSNSIIKRLGLAD